MDSTNIVAFNSQKHTTVDFVRPEDGSGFDPAPSSELKKFGHDDYYNMNEK